MAQVDVEYGWASKGASTGQVAKYVGWGLGAGGEGGGGRVGGEGSGRVIVTT